MKLKKLAVFVLSTFLTFNSFSFTFADEREVLTVENAVEQAIKYSKTLKNYSEENEVNDVQIKSTKQTFLSSGETDQIVSLAIQLKELYAKVEKNKLSAEVEKQSIEFSVFSFFVDIIKAENGLTLFEKEADLKEKQLKVSEAKVKYGRLSKNEYESQQLEYKTLLKQKNELQNSIDDAYISLNKVLGNDLNDKYNLDLGEEITYSNLGQVELESVILMAISSSAEIKAQETNVDIAKYAMNSFVKETGTETKAAKVAEYNKQTRTLEDLKTSLREKITKNYNEIIKNENEHKSNLSELENMQKQLQIKELNLKLGKATEIEVEEYKYEIEKLQNTIQEQTYEHELLVRKFNNPALL